MKTIGKYEICGLLGRGGMGRIYKVKLPVIQKIVALKRLEPDPLLEKMMGTENLRNLFLSEAVTMAGLRHPNIVEVLDFDEADGRLFYVMNYYCNNLGTMIGETYQTEKPSRIIRVEKAIHYTRQILMGLSRLHHAGIIHRDIKPYNILVTDYDTVKICDFGLSKLRGEAFRGPSNLKVGSPWYAAPEQEEAPDHADFGADIYAVGIMLYRMLTGKLPSQPHDLPSRFNPDLDEEWDGFIKKATASNPRDRFLAAADMLKELNALSAAWEAKKEKICSLPLSPPKYVSEPVSGNLRSRGEKVRPQNAQKKFSLDDLWRPLSYIQNDFKTNSDGTVTDRKTGLIWEQSGSPYPLTWEQARDRIEDLNRKQFAGRNRWRLPTADELCSLLTEPPQGKDLCIEPVFDQTQKWLWSSDTRSYIAAWYVSVDMGFVAWQDFSAYYYARGVCEIDSRIIEKI
jgi:serine/threonine-protein kinase